MVHHRSVSIPFYISNLRELRKEIVNDREHKFLHLRIRKVEHHLCSSTAHNRFTLWCFDDPVRMLLVEFRSGVCHLWFNPNTKLHTILLRIRKETFNALWKFLGVHHPVAESSIIC